MKLCIKHCQYLVDRLITTIATESLWYCTTHYNYRVMHQKLYLFIDLHCIATVTKAYLTTTPQINSNIISSGANHHRSVHIRKPKKKDD